MNIYWIVNLAIWAAAMIVSAKGAYIAAFLQRRARRGDAMRLAVFLVSLVMAAHIVRWLYAPTDVESWKAIYIVGALTGCYVLRLMFAYGRGELVASIGGRREDNRDG